MRAKALFLVVWALLPALWLTAGRAASAASESDLTKLRGYSQSGGAETQVVVVPIDGTIDLGLAAFAERVLGDASAGDVVILKIKTFGGRVDAAVRIRDALLAATATTVAFIDGRAISAGALISLACDTIIMSHGASIGAATPVQSGSSSEMKPTSEKVVSFMRAEMRATAIAKGRRGDVAEAMVDADVAIDDVIVKGKLLTLTTTEALDVAIADAQAENLDAAISLLNLGAAEVSQSDTHWGEKVARALTDPAVSSMLMTFGFAGVLMELYSPGLGIPGIVGATCLALFFFGQYAAQLWGWEEALVLGAGAVFLLLEALVVPGFGVAGVIGLVLVVLGFAMALVEFGVPVDIAFELGYIDEAFSEIGLRMGLLVLALVVFAAILMKRLPNLRFAQWLILKDRGGGNDGYVEVSSEHSVSVGARGVADSPLRPSGIAVIDGKRIDVLTRGDFIEPGAAVQVLSVDGNRVVVGAVGDSDVAAAVTGASAGEE